MTDFKIGLTIICLLAVALVVIFIVCRYFKLTSYVRAWIDSTKEEKIGLTKLKGHYDANGILVKSDSGIQIGTSGSFKRFESVDNDLKFPPTISVDERGVQDLGGIPPQPLRPAPIPMALQKPSKLTIETTTSITPIPRPVSSMNMAELAAQSQFPVCIAPPPSPAPLSTNKMLSATLSHHIGIENNTTDEGEVISSVLKRAISCDSLCSDTSVALDDLEEPNVTGYLCIGLEYDSECGDVIVNVLEAKDLIGPAKDDNLIDSYVKVFLLPDKTTNVQTRVYRSSRSPSYKERFLFSLNPGEQSQRSLYFHIYCTDRLSHTLIGEGELRLGDVSLKQPVTTWITLTDTGQKTEFGELMFSLSYLPTAERLTVVVVKARNLRFQNDKVAGDPFVKVYLLHNGKKIHKKKTTSKKAERSPIFNEAMIFSVPAHTLQTIQLRLTVAESPLGESSQKAYSIGHIIVGAQATGRPLNHWNQMLTALRKPVAMWHPLRK